MRGDGNRLFAVKVHQSARTQLLSIGGRRPKSFENVPSKETAKLLGCEAGTPESCKQEAPLDCSPPVNRYDDQLVNSFLRENHVTSGLSLDDPSSSAKCLDGFQARDVGQDAHRYQSGGGESEAQLGHGTSTTSCGAGRRYALGQRFKIQGNRLARVSPNLGHGFALSETARELRTLGPVPSLLGAIDFDRELGFHAESYLGKLLNPSGAELT